MSSYELKVSEHYVFGAFSTEAEDALLAPPAEPLHPITIERLGMVSCNIGGCIYWRNGDCKDAGVCLGGDPVNPG